MKVPFASDEVYGLYRFNLDNNDYSWSHIENLEGSTPEEAQQDFIKRYKENYDPYANYYDEKFNVVYYLDFMDSMNGDKKENIEMESLKSLLEHSKEVLKMVVIDEEINELFKGSVNALIVSIERQLRD